MRAAVVHEWVSARAGSEKVFEALAASLPDADLWCLSYEPGVELHLGGRVPRRTWLDRPWARAHRGLTLPLMPLAWNTSGRCDHYDLVVSSHHSFASSTRLAHGAVHLSYVHSPARYLWSPELDRRGSAWALRPARRALQKIDLRAVKSITDVAANSTEVAERVRRFWRRDARVIAPPVDVDFYRPALQAQPTRDFLLGFSRFIPYKRLDLVIEVGVRLGMPVVIAGQGPELPRLRQLAEAATVPVTIRVAPSDHEIRELYRNARALIFPGLEDFGIIPVEAQACGTPVVGLSKGGTRDTVMDGTSGVLVDDPTAQRLTAATSEAMQLKSSDCRESSERFSMGHFQANVRQWLDDFGGRHG